MSSRDHGGAPDRHSALSRLRVAERSQVSAQRRPGNTTGLGSLLNHRHGRSSDARAQTVPAARSTPQRPASRSAPDRPRPASPGGAGLWSSRCWSPRSRLALAILVPGIAQAEGEQVLGTLHDQHAAVPSRASGHGRDRRRRGGRLGRDRRGRRWFASTSRARASTSSAIDADDAARGRDARTGGRQPHGHRRDRAAGSR